MLVQAISVLDFLYLKVQDIKTMTPSQKTQLVSNAKLWFNRLRRTADEKEAYLFALQDAGVPQKVVDIVENVFYPESN